MDPEIVKELNESLRELSDTLRNQSSELVNYTNRLANSNASVANNTNAVNAASKSNDAALQSTTRYGQTMSETDKVIQEQNAKFSAALSATKTAALDFGKALVSADTSLTKYGSSASQLGGQAWEVGKNFGIAGKVIGGLLGGLGLAANSILKLDQNIIDFRDGFAKQAGILPITTTELGNLAKEAGFAYNRMPMLAKTVQNLGPSLLSLGGYAGEGAVRFMRIADVGEDVRKKFSKMGLQQEALLEYQSYYIELQKSGGQSQANKRKTDQQIQRESLAYSEHLLVLSSLTGEKAAAIKDRQQAVLETIEEQARIARDRTRIKELEAMGTREGDAEAKRINDELIKRQKLGTELAATTSVEAGKRAMTMKDLGGYSASMGGEATKNTLEVVRQYEKTGDASAAAADYNRKLIEGAARLPAAAAEHDKKLFETFSTGDAEVLNRAARQQGISVKDIEKDLKGKETAEDPLAEAAASIQEIEILASQKFQTFLESIDPLRHGLELFTTAAVVAASAIGGGLLIAGVAKVIGGKFGELGSPSNPMHAKIVSGPDAGGAGGFVKKIFGKSSAATGAAGAASAAGAAASTAPLAKAGAGASALSGAAGSAGGSKVGIFLIGLSKGLSALGKAAPQVLLGAGAISGSIALIGAGVAGATWILGKSLPSLATGLKAFDKVDGDRISKIGTGMAGLGAGLLAVGGSNITTAMGNIAKWATGDDTDPIQNLQKQLQDFQKIKVDPGKIEKNSKAFISFNKMLAQATEINGTVAGALSRAFGNFFEVDLPLQKFKTFSDLEINPEQVGKNATAFKLFSEAMSSYKGYGTLGALSIISKALGNSVVSFFTSIPTDDPIKRFQKFSEINIDGKQTKTNAIAFKDFANAMAEYKGGPNVLDAISQLAGSAMMSIFQIDGPIDAFEKFAKKDFGPNMEKNSEALSKYANAKSGGGSSPGGGGSSPGGGGSSPGGGSGASAAAPSSSSGAAPAADAATASSGASGPAPVIGAGKDAILSHAKLLNPNERAEFYKSLASQGMQKSAAARKAGNGEQASHWEKAASSYTLAASIAESSAQNTSAGGAWKTSGQGYVYPVPEGTDTSSYGNRTHPIRGGTRFHTGLDIGKGRGSPIIAAADGKITRTSYDTSPYKGFGQIAIQDHGDGLQSVYAHLDKYNVREGDTVSKGKQIGTMGSTGMSTGPHLHYILQKAGGFSVPSKANTIDPKSKITERAKGKAEKGGIFTGFDSMFTEGMAEAQKIGALDPASLIAKLGKTTVEEVATTTKDVATLGAELDTDLTPDLLTMIESKLEKVLYALENNQSTHEKILKSNM